MKLVRFAPELAAVSAALDRDETMRRLDAAL
jgi:hypothetical protein